MGRAKAINKFIEKEKKRNSAYLMKRKTLVKKAYELSVLCDVPTCVIIYPFAPKNTNNNKSSRQPEVFTFKGEIKAKPVSDSDSSKARELINRYLTVLKEVRDKIVSRKLSDVIIDDDDDDDDEKSSVNKEELVSFNTDVSAFSVDQLIELLGYLDYKLKLVRRKIDIVKGVMVPPKAMMMGDFGNNLNKFDDQLKLQGQVLNGLEPLGFNGNNFEFKGGVSVVGGGGHGGAYRTSFVGPSYYGEGLRFGDDDHHMNMSALQWVQPSMNAMLSDFSSSIRKFY